MSRKMYRAMVLIWCVLPSWVNAQLIYTSTLSAVHEFNLATCSSTLLVAAPAFNDMAVSPSGLFYGINNDKVVSVNQSTGAVTIIATIGFSFSSLEYGVDGFLYAMGTQITQVNPTTGAVVPRGSLPAGWASIGDLVYLEGTYYGTVLTPAGSKLANVNLLSPGSSTIVSTLPLSGLVAGASVSHPTCPKLYWFTFFNPRQCWEYDVNSATWSLKCAALAESYGGADSQNDYTFPLVCPFTCTTNAGNIAAQNFNLCGTTPTVTVPFIGGEVLDANDVLRYILFTNPANPTGSILAQSATPTFSFNAGTMTLGQTYYLAALAGNQINGMVDLTDPCLDLSNIITVRWNALPTVSFSVPQGATCAGFCHDVGVVFTGTPPFNLTYTATAVAGQTTQTSLPNTILQVCPPVSFTGPLTVTATALTDANCTCP